MVASSAAGMAAFAYQPPTIGRISFMHLPPELRNHIYGLALAHHVPLLIDRYQIKTPKSAFRKKTRYKMTYKLTCTTPTIGPRGKLESGVPAKNVLGAGLLSASKTLNAEAIAIFLSENHFVFTKPVALHDFVLVLGIKAKSICRITLKKTEKAASNDNLLEHICVLSRLQKPKSISIGARAALPPLGYSALVALSPEETWKMIKPIVWQSNHLLKPGMSFRPIASIEAQLDRLKAFDFDVSGAAYILVKGSSLQGDMDDEERKVRFKELVTECWRKDATVAGVRRKREEGGFYAEEDSSAKARRI